MEGVTKHTPRETKQMHGWMILFALMAMLAPIMAFAGDQTLAPQMSWTRIRAPVLHRVGNALGARTSLVSGVKPTNGS